MTKADIGLLGLAVMGQNLALNIANNGFNIAVYNRSESRTSEFISQNGNNNNITAHYSPEDFVASLKKPAIIIIMVKAGNPVDMVIEQLLQYLAPGDIIIDGGNSFFRDSQRRYKELKAKGIEFLATGISGGEEGALNGPSIMPGGSLDAYKHAEPILTKIAAQVQNQPCCEFLGPDGAGHFVKMVHNGIEYGDMQLISEIYLIMRDLLKLDTQQMHDIFKKLNQGPLNSYLIEIVADILLKKDDLTDNPLVDMILDCARQKGTGTWTSQNAMELSVPLPTITEAVFARDISVLKQQRQLAAAIFPHNINNFDTTNLTSALASALYAAKICCYAQGFALLKQASITYNWNLNLGNIAMIWRGGCIIKAQFLDRIKEAFDRQPDLENILLDDYFAQALKDSQNDCRIFIASAIQNGLPIPALASAISYFDSYRCPRSGANLIQAMRDYFGAHLYQRIDKDGQFHTNWL